MKIKKDSKYLDFICIYLITQQFLLFGGAKAKHSSCAPSYVHVCD